MDNIICCIVGHNALQLVGELFVSDLIFLIVQSSKTYFDDWNPKMSDFGGN